MPRLVILAGTLVAFLALSLLAMEADHPAPQQVLVSLKASASLRLSDVSRSLAEASEEMEGTCQIDGDALRLVDGATIAVTGMEGEEQLEALFKDAVPGIEGAQIRKMESILTATLRVRAGTVVPFMKLVTAVEGQGGHVLDVMFQPAQMPEERPEQPSMPGPAPQAPQGGGC